MMIIVKDQYWYLIVVEEMVEYVRNFKEWGLYCIFYLKGIWDQCDKILQYVLNGLLQNMI